MIFKSYIFKYHKMGIKNLHKLLRKHSPAIYEEIHISEYAYKKVAIDISLYLCKFKSIAGDRWLTSFVNLISCLRKNEVHCIFIYDGKATSDKDAEKKKRVEEREKLSDKVNKLESFLEKYHLTGEVDDSLIELYKKNLNKDTKDYKIKRLLLRKKENEKDNTFDIKIAEELVRKMRSHILNIKQEDFDLTRELFDILKVPYYNAPHEAETLCSDLCNRGLVDAVLSEDTDVLAYETPVFLSNINTSSGVCIRIKYETLLKEIDLTSSQFLDLCIMCGTDYNSNIFNVGPEKAYKYIKEYISIEEIGKKLSADITILNHVRVRELFREFKRVDDIKVVYCGSPDFIKLETFVKTNKLQSNIDTLKKCFTHNTVVFEDDSETV